MEPMDLSFGDEFLFPSAPKKTFPRRRFGIRASKWRGQILLGVSQNKRAIFCEKMVAQTFNDILGH